MNFAHPLLEKSVDIKEGEYLTLVIENPIALRNTVHWFKNETPELVLSENFTPIDIGKNTEFIDNIFELNFSAKHLISNINDEAEAVAEEYQSETLSLLGALNNYASLITAKLDYPVDFTLISNVEKVMKLFNFSVHTDNVPLPEALLTYMELCRDFLKKKLFVLLNFKGFVSDEEFSAFRKGIEYEKFCVIFLEAFDCSRSCELERKIIIDNDLCVLYDENDNFE